MIVNAIVQARMNSTRLPGKVMLTAAGKPLIGHLVDRLRQCKEIDRVIVAGPMLDQHSALHRYLTEIECDHFFGEEENDLCARFLSAIALFPCDAFVRVCGDSPLIEPVTVDSHVYLMRELKQNFFSNAGAKIYPRGQSIEGCTVEFYQQLCKMCGAQDREHAGFPYIYREIAKHNALVDTPEDFERVKRMIESA